MFQYYNKEMNGLMLSHEIKDKKIIFHIIVDGVVVTCVCCGVPYDISALIY